MISWSPVCVKQCTEVRPFSDDSDSTSDLLVIRPEQCQALGRNLATCRLAGTDSGSSIAGGISFLSGKNPTSGAGRLVEGECRRSTCCCIKVEAGILTRFERANFEFNHEVGMWANMIEERVDVPGGIGASDTARRQKVWI